MPLVRPNHPGPSSLFIPHLLLHHHHHHHLTHHWCTWCIQHTSGASRQLFVPQELAVGAELKWCNWCTRQASLKRYWWRRWSTSSHSHPQHQKIDRTSLPCDASGFRATNVQNIPFGAMLSGVSFYKGWQINPPEFLLFYKIKIRITVAWGFDHMFLNGRSRMGPEIWNQVLIFSGGFSNKRHLPFFLET